MSTDPNWQPMDTMPRHVHRAWLYSFSGVYLGSKGLGSGEWFDDLNDCRGHTPVRWAPFLKPAPPKDIRL